MNWNFQEILTQDPCSAWGCDTSGNIPPCGVALRRTCRCTEFHRVKKRISASPVRNVLKCSAISAACFIYKLFTRRILTGGQHFVPTRRLSNTIALATDRRAVDVFLRLLKGFTPVLKPAYGNTPSPPDYATSEWHTSVVKPLINDGPLVTPPWRNDRHGNHQKRTRYLARIMRVNP